MTTSPLHSQTEDKLANYSNIEHEKTTPVSCTDAQRQSGFPCQIRSTTYLVERTSEDESKSQTDSVKRVRIKDRPIPSKSTTAIKTKPKAGYKSSGLHTCPEKHDKNQNPKLDSSTITLSKKNLKRRQNSYLPILTKINLARLKKANLLDSPYLQGLKNFDSNIGDGNKPSKTVDPYTKTTFLENTAYNLDRRASRTQSAGALEKCMSSVHAQWGRVLTAISGSMNTRDNGYNGSRTCSGLANENPYTVSEVDRVKAQYKNFLSQTNKTEPRTISSFKPQTPNSAEKICPVVDETLQNSRLKERNGSKSTTKLNINVEIETEKKSKTSGENAQTDPVKNIRPSSRIHNQSKAQTKMAKKVRNICYQCDRSKYWSNEIRNYYEWNAFCLLRKYRNNTQKIKEEMRLLAQDGNLEMDDLWKRAEAFHDFIQDERKESAKSLQAPGFAKTIDVKKFRYNPQLQNAQTESYKECANVKKACLSNRKKVKPMKATSLVPPPQAPQLSFLVPKIHRDMNRMCTPKIHSKPAVSPALPSNKTSFQDTRLPHVTTADKLKSKIIMELMQFSTDKNPPAEKRPKTARKNFSTPRWEPVVNVLELVTSYIPESKSTSFTSNRNRRLSF